MPNAKYKARARLAEKYFDNRCYICHKKHGKWFAVHHIGYQDEGEVRYSDYSSSEKYNKALERVIRENPDRFVLLCRNHHSTGAWFAELRDEVAERMMELRRRTQEFKKATAG